jgi:hypothetical protein
VQSDQADNSQQSAHPLSLKQWTAAAAGARAIVVLLLLVELKMCCCSSSSVLPWEAIQDEAALTSSSTLLQPVMQHLQNTRRQTQNTATTGPYTRVHRTMQHGAATNVHLTAASCWKALDGASMQTERTLPAGCRCSRLAAAASVAAEAAAAAAAAVLP